MAIFRPQQAASYCEYFATRAARIARFYSGTIGQMYLAEQRTYELRRARVILKYSIECCALPPHKSGDAA